MSLPLMLLQGVTTVAGAIVFWRAVMAINNMGLRHCERRSLAAFLGCGLSYVMLAAAAAGSVLACWTDQLHVGLSAWTVATAGLLVSQRVCGQRLQP